MLRILIASLAALAAAACGYRSSIDLAPMSDRIAQPVIPAGDYCEATASSPPYMVKSAEDCGGLLWDQANRAYLIEPDEDGEEPAPAAAVALGDDLYLLQSDAGEEGGPGRYTAVLTVAKGSAFFTVPTLGRKDIQALAAKHPGVKLTADGDRSPIITGGEPAAIRTFLKAAARKALQDAKLEDEELSIAIRDRAGAPDHEANGMQTMNIIELVTALFALRDAG